MANRRFARNAVLKIHALGTPLIKEKAVARLLKRLGAVDGTQFIDEVLLLAREGWEPASCVLSNVVNALMNVGELGQEFDFRGLAKRQELASVEALFTEGKAAKEYDARVAAKADAKLFSDALGYLKERARLTRSPDELARLVQASEPSVIRNALLNPRVTEDLVVRMAAKRPARPEPLVEIWRSSRWSCRLTVRRALAFNPYLPPEIGCKIVPLLRNADLRELASASSLHPSLREQASRLLRSRRTQAEDRSQGSGAT